MTDVRADSEVEALRARVAQLETELADQAARTNAAVAAAQARAYWLDRWHLDLNALMEKPGAEEFRVLLRTVRAVVRKTRAAWRGVSG